VKYKALYVRPAKYEKVLYLGLPILKYTVLKVLVQNKKLGLQVQVIWMLDGNTEMSKIDRTSVLTRDNPRELLL